MPLSAESLQNALPQHPLRYHERLNSTNESALAWLQEGAPTGALVIADEQLRGRGRKGRTWHTLPNTAIALSIILHPTPDALKRMTLLGALAVTDTLYAWQTPQTGIKWPNDVLVRQRKICGILPESIWDGDQLRGVVLGIGVNIRADFTGTPIEHSAISLEDVLQKPVSRLDFTRKLVQQINYWYAQLETPRLFETWRERLLGIGAPVLLQGPDGPFTGIAERVDPDGALWVRTDDGQQHRIIAGDIELA